MAIVATDGGGLGYRYVRDPRAENFLMAPRLASTSMQALPTEKEWALGPTLDQGQQGSCVGHGWAHWRNAEPVQPNMPYTHADAVGIYDWAQQNDEWTDTPPEEGTSVQAGAKCMMSMGALEAGYVWGTTVNDLLKWLGTIGPVVMGTLWLSGMQPDRNGYVKAEGLIDGGHCYLAYGYHQVTSLIGNGERRIALKFQNSWGNGYADGGCFYMFVEEFQKLLNRGHYAMCSALEIAPALPPTPPTPPAPEPEPEPDIEWNRVSTIDLYHRPANYAGKHVEIYQRRRGNDRTLWRGYPVG